MLVVELLLVACLSVAGSAFVVRKWFPRIVIVKVPINKVIYGPPPDKRFRVVFATDLGAEARRLYEKVTTRGDGRIEFWENDHRRSLKKGKE